MSIAPHIQKERNFSENMRHKKGDDMHERKKDTNTVAHD
jgi:hypothetical protein